MGSTRLLAFATLIGLVCGPLIASSYNQEDAYYNPTDILLNRLEIKSISHVDATELHPRADFRIYKVFDPTKREGKNAVNAPKNDFHFLDFIPKNPYEIYAGMNKDHGFRYSLEIERYPEGSLNYVTEVLSMGRTIEGLDKYKARISKFHPDKKLKSMTTCEGYLKKGELPHKYLRLKGSKKNAYQSYFSCRTFTGGFCNFINKNKKSQVKMYINQKAIPNEEPFLVDKVRELFKDKYTFQREQRKNYTRLRKMMTPGGPHTYARWPAEENLHNIVGLIPGDESDPKNIDWMVESCGRFEVMANPHPELDNAADTGQPASVTPQGARSK